MIAVVCFRPWIAIWGPLVARGAGALAAHPAVNRHHYFVIHVIGDDIPVVRIAYARTSSVFLNSRRARTGSGVRLVAWLVTRAHEPVDV